MLKVKLPEYEPSQSHHVPVYGHSDHDKEKSCSEEEVGEVKTYPGAWMGGAAVVGMSELRHGAVSRGLVGWLVPPWIRSVLPR